MSTTARIGWAALIVATLYVCYFSHLGAIGFVGPDEPRYAWVAREMVESGDWVTPRLYGKPWFEKPPLYYWGAAICFKLFGVNEAAARLPSAISALLATLALAWLAWRVYGAETARWLLLLLPTTLGMIGFSHAAATDMPFSGMLTLAMVCATVIVGLVPEESCRDGAQNAAPLPGEAKDARRRWVALILSGFFLGLAVLAKGPAAIILCGGAVFFWVVFTKRWRDGVRLLHPVGMAAFCITALPWYVLCARRNPDFFRVFIIEHNFKRFLTPEFQHIQPFWFYVPVILIAVLPWSLGLLAIPFRSAWRSPSEIFLLSFALFPLLFFTASQSKLPGYVLPSLPPLLCLLSRTNTIVAKRRREVLAVSFVITTATLAVAIERFTSRHALGSDILPAPWTSRVWLPLLLGVIIAVLPLVRRHPAASTCTIQIGVLLAVLGLFSGISWLDPQFSARGVIAQVFLARRQVIPDVLTYDLPRGIHYGLNFYLHREIPEWSPGAYGVVFSSWTGEPRLISEGYSCEHHTVLPVAVLCQQRNGLAGDAAGGGKVK